MAYDTIHNNGVKNSYPGIAMSPQHKESCPPWLCSMGKAFDDPLESILKGFISDKAYWEEPEDHMADRNTRSIRYASVKGVGREAMAPIQFTNHEILWGGGLRRATSGGVGPRREDEHYYVSRDKDPTVNPVDYVYYFLPGLRVAVPKTVPNPDVQVLLFRIYQYGPKSMGYARIGDTLVPAILGSSDRQTLV